MSPPAAAVLLGERDPHEVQRAELGDDLVGHGLACGRARRRPARPRPRRTRGRCGAAARGGRRGRGPSSRQYERPFIAWQHLGSHDGYAGIAMAVNERSSTGVTAERIHDAALTLFNERGYTGTTVRELADACDLTPGRDLQPLRLQGRAAVRDRRPRPRPRRRRPVRDAARRRQRRRRSQLEALAAAFTAFHIARPRETRVANRDYIYLPARRARQRRAPPPPRARAVRRRPARGRAPRRRSRSASSAREDAIQAASMAILNMVVLVAEWFDPGRPAQRRTTPPRCTAASRCGSHAAAAAAPDR